MRKTGGCRCFVCGINLCSIDPDVKFMNKTPVRLLTEELWAAVDGIWAELNRPIGDGSELWD